MITKRTVHCLHSCTHLIVHAKCLCLYWCALSLACLVPSSTCHITCLTHTAYAHHMQVLLADLHAEAKCVHTGRRKRSAHFTRRAKHQRDTWRCTAVGIGTAKTLTSSERSAGLACCDTYTDYAASRRTNTEGMQKPEPFPALQDLD